MKLKNQNYFDGVYHLKNEIEEENRETRSSENTKNEKKKPLKRKKGE